MRLSYRTRRLLAALVIAIVSLTALGRDMLQQQSAPPAAVPGSPTTTMTPKPDVPAEGDATAELSQLPVKGKAAKTGYTRTQFSNGWSRVGDCDIRNIILRRDIEKPEVDAQCKVVRGTLHDPYTGADIEFVRGPSTSDKIQIDHVVALSNAWQTGAQQITPQERLSLANDPLNLLAVDGKANQDKGDSDAASWLPPHKQFRCQYVARQIAVKKLYKLWVTDAERRAMTQVLADCPGQRMPVQ